MARNRARLMSGADSNVAYASPSLNTPQSKPGANQSDSEGVCIPTLVGIRYE